MNGTEVLVTGGTGALGSKVVERLRSNGIEPCVLSHSNRPGTIRGELLTGEGLEAAVRGVHTIVHCASSPLRKARQTDVGGTDRLLEIASKAGVSHVVGGTSNRWADRGRTSYATTTSPRRTRSSETDAPWPS
jgi:nucleoside-diphosphate-sugar epimerase